MESGQLHELRKAYPGNMSFRPASYARGLASMAATPAYLRVRPRLDLTMCTVYVRHSGKINIADPNLAVETAGIGG